MSRLAKWSMVCGWGRWMLLAVLVSVLTGGCGRGGSEVRAFASGLESEWREFSTLSPEVGGEGSRERIRVDPKSTLPEELRLVPVTLRARELAYADAVSAVSSALGVPIVGAPGDSRPVTVDWREVPAGDALAYLAAWVGRVVAFDGSVVALAEPAAVGAVGVIEPGWMAAEPTAQAVGSSMGEGVALKPLGGLLVASGSEAGVRRALDAAESLAAARPDSWVFSVAVVSVNADDLRTLGVSVDSSGSVQLDVSDPRSVAVEGLIRAGWEARGSLSSVRGLTRGSVVVIEGAKGSWSAGERVPIPRRTVSPQGTVTVGGYDFVEVGYLCEIQTWRTPEGVGVTIKPEVGAVVGYVEEAPRIAKRSVEASALLRDGSLLVLSGLDDWRQERSGAWIGLGGSERDSAARTLVIVRAARVPRGR